MIPFVRTFTDFGDLAVLLPLVAVITIWLLAIRQSATLLWWVAAVALCIGSTAILKVYFFICPPLTDLHSPSGHTSLSTLVYGSLTLAIAAASAGWRRSAVVAAGAAFIAGIGISRVLIHAHSIREVVVGSIIGVIALALFAHRFWRHPPAEPRLRGLVVSAALLMVLLNGQALRAEDFLHAIGIYLDRVGMSCF
jgi:membrane-associated phospholipid phosphatase